MIAPLLMLLKSNSYLHLGGMGFPSITIVIMSLLLAPLYLNL